MVTIDKWMPFLHKNIELIDIDNVTYKGFFNDIDWREDTDLDCELLDLEMEGYGIVFRPDEIKEIKLA